MSEVTPPRRRRPASTAKEGSPPDPGIQPASGPRRRAPGAKAGEVGRRPTGRVAAVTAEEEAPPARRTARRRPANRPAPDAGAVPAPAPPALAASASELPGAVKPAPGLWWRLGFTNVAAIARREIAAYFVSPIGYVVTAVLIVLVSLLGYLSQIVLTTPVAMDSIFSLFALLMVFFTPLYTMRLYAEERRAGTLELLLSHPVRDWEVVVGKWLASFVFYLASAAFTLIYPVLIAIYDPIPNRYLVAGHVINIPGLDPGALFTGYLGLILVGAAWVAIGGLASSLTSNQIVAAILGIGMLMFLDYLAMSISLSTQGQVSQFFDYLSSANRSQSFGQGRLVLQDVIYFASLTLGALFLTTRVLDSRRWR